MPYKPMVAAPIIALSKTLEHFPPHDKLDNKEVASCETAFAALMYQEGVKMNAWALVGMCMVGIGAPRVIKYFAERDRVKDERKASINHDEISKRLQAEREKLASHPPLATPSTGRGAESDSGRTNGVHVGGSASESEPVKKELTAEQAVAIIQFPEGKN